MHAVIARYVAYARIGAARARRERAELYGRMVFFAVVLGVFSSLWRAVAEAGMPIAASPKAMVWYLAATEWIFLSAPPIHLEVQETIRRGDIVYRLGQPASFVGAELASGLGVLAMRLPILAATAFLCAFAFTGWIPPLDALLRFVPFAIVASAMTTSLSLGIGLLAFWLHEVTPVFWVWQKLTFVLGGLMLPLELYPGFIRTIAAWTPFPALLAAPASFVLGTAPTTPAALAVRQVAWSAVTAVAVSLIFRRARATVTAHGG